MPEGERQRMLLVTRNLPPLVGGMERLVSHMASTLESRYTLGVVGPTGCTAHLPPGVEVREVRHRRLARFLVGSLAASWAFASRGGFTAVLAGSGLTAPAAWLSARRAGCPFVAYLHGLDVIAPSRLYQWCWLPFIRRADLVLVNSENTANLAIGRGVPAGAIEVVHPGTELPSPDPYAGGAFRARQGLGDRPVMLVVGRLTPRKGLSGFVSHALPGILARHPEALLVVLGDDPGDAVRAQGGSERDRIMHAASAAGVHESIRFLSRCDDAMLHAAYFAADVHVFPVIDTPGDVEGFGMVAIEAAAHGLPTVGFATGGVPDAVVDATTGSLVAPGDYRAFGSQVLRWLALRDRPAVRERCAAAATAYGWDRFDRRFLQCLARVAAPVR